MKRLLLVLAVLAVTQELPAGEEVPVPWTEFKRLYRESIEREVMQKQARPPEKKEPMAYTIEEAEYSLEVGEETVRGEALVTGRIIGGDPAPIPLFGGNIVVAGIKQVAGGSLLSGCDNRGSLLFLPDGRKEEFQVLLSFLVQPREDSTSRFISFAVPAALRNSLRLELPADTELLEQPGIADGEGVYHFSARESLEVRFVDKKGVAAAGLVDIDTFSRVRLQGKRSMITTAFAPAQPLPDSFIVQVQADAQYISSSLKSSWIGRQPDGSYEISIPAEESCAFSMQFAVDETVEGGFAFMLPGIGDNSGREGNFVVEEPDDSQVAMAGKGMVEGIPVARLSAALAGAAGSSRSYAHIAPGEEIRLSVTRFKAVSTAPIVLESQYFFASFEENGNVLSVLSLDVPPEIGPRLQLKSVPDSEIWSLTVNGKKRKVYTNDDNTWIIPLEDGEVSRVQLALLYKGEKLGLHGRLATALPETGLPSRNVRVGIALPERVQLLSLEGPVSPAPGESWETPDEFVGKPHFFSRSFYKGQGMELAVSYKEPVDR